MSARVAQLELEKLRPRVCRLVSSYAGPSAAGLVGGDVLGESMSFNPDTVVAECLPVILRRLVDGGAVPPAPNAAEGERHAKTQAQPEVRAAAGEGSMCSGKTSAAGGMADPVAALTADRGPDASDAGEASESAPVGGAEGVRACLDELCRLHEELGVVGQLSADVGNTEALNRRTAAIYVRRAEVETRLAAAVAVADTATAESAAAATAAADGSGTRSGVGKPYKPRRRVSPMPASHDGEHAAAVAARGRRDGGNLANGAGSGAMEPGAANTMSSAAGAGGPASGNAPKNPYARVRELQPSAQRRRTVGHEDGLAARQRQLTLEDRVRLNTSQATAGKEADGDRPPRRPTAALSPYDALFLPSPSQSRSGTPAAVVQPPTGSLRFGRVTPAQAGIPPAYQGSVSSLPGGVRRARAANRRGLRMEEAERLLSAASASGDDLVPGSFFSSLPSLPLPSRSCPSGGSGRSASAPSDSSVTAAVTGGVGHRRGEAGNPAATSGTNVDGGGDVTAGAQRSHKLSCQLRELAELYCGRCREASERLQLATVEGEAISALTTAYLCGEGGRASGRGAVAAGDGLSWRSTMSGILSGRARTATTWGGDGRLGGGRGSDWRNSCCVACTTEVRSAHVGVPCKSKACSAIVGVRETFHCHSGWRGSSAFCGSCGRHALECQTDGSCYLAGVCQTLAPRKASALYIPCGMIDT